MSHTIILILAVVWAAVSFAIIRSKHQAAQHVNSFLQLAALVAVLFFAFPEPAPDRAATRSAASASAAAADPAPTAYFGPVTAATARPTQKPSGKKTYILNTNTKKFHLPSCPSVDQMKDKNKKKFTGTRQQVINMGYDPCNRCDP